MGLVVILLAIGFIAFAASHVAHHEKEIAKAWLLGVVSLSFFTLTTLGVAPVEFGYGVVSGAVQPYSLRLKAGEVYQLVTSVQDGETQVLFVKKVTSDKAFFAIRVTGKTTPPEYFTLIKGEPAAIAPPAKS